MINTILLILLVGSIKKNSLTAVNEKNQEAAIEIYNIEDYVKFSESVSSGEMYVDQVISLCADLDFTGMSDLKMIGESEDGNVFNCCASTEAYTGEIQRGVVENCYLIGAEDVEALNANLPYVSGYFEDVQFYQWEMSGERIFSEKRADLLKKLSTRIVFSGKELKLQGFYSSNERCWCIALPATCAEQKLVLEAYTSDGGYDSFKRTPGEETMIFTWKEKLYPIRFLCAENLETMYVTLEGNTTLASVHVDKTIKSPGVLSILNTDGSLQECVLKGFYGHGNDSWSAPKRSYNLKMDERTDLLGLGKNEDFALFAGYRDDSLMNYCATTEFIKELGFPYAPDYRLVNLYVSGEYVGVCFLAEKVELDENRIDITSVYEETKWLNHDNLKNGQIQEWKDAETSAARYYYDIENNPEDITGGYLLEADICDYEADESRFVSERSIPFTLKRAKYSSEEQVTYISQFWQDFEDGLFSESGYNTKGKHYTEYIDVESFAKQWLLYELVQEGSMSNSIYFYKESDVTGDGLLHACIPWDMEHSYTITDKIGELWNTGEKSGTLYGYWSVFYNHEDFRAELRKVWDGKFVPAIELMIEENAVITEKGMKNLRWYEEQIKSLSLLENS